MTYVCEGEGTKEGRKDDNKSCLGRMRYVIRRERMEVIARKTIKRKE